VRVNPLGLAFRVAKKFAAVVGELLLLGTTPVAGSNPAPTANIRATKAPWERAQKTKRKLGLLAGKL
jgi:hypothetical protein